jgi:hypothetical protein
MPWPRLLLIILGAVIAYSLLHFYLQTHPPKFRSQATPAALGLAYEDVRLVTRDGLTLAGWLVGNDTRKPVIIVGHGYPFDKGNILPVAAFLHPEFSLLYLDFRSFGQSEGSYSTGGLREAEDVHAAVRFLKGRGFRRIGGLGFSLGAAAILLAESPDIRAIVADSGYARLDWLLPRTYPLPRVIAWPLVQLARIWGLVFLHADLADAAPMEALRRSTVPVLLVHGERDSQIPSWHSGRMREARPANTTLWLVPAAGHGQASAAAAGEYERRVRAFFREHLG